MVEINPIILIVDDEQAGREAMESILLNQGYRLMFASQGVEAISKARELAPDIILLDIMMPGMDGFEVCRRLRADTHLSEVPIVLVTALDDRESRLQGIEVGADDFITKPIDRMELRVRVRSITRLNRYRRLQEERAKLSRQLDRMTALRTVDLAISASLDMVVALDVLLQQVLSQLDVEASAILLYNQETQMLEYKAGRGFYTRAVETSRFRVGESAAGRAALEHRLISIPDLREDRSLGVRSALIKGENFQSYFCAPLQAKGKVVGVLEIFSRRSLTPDQDWLDFLETLAQQASIAIENARLFEQLHQSTTNLTRAYEETLEGWSRALDLRDHETEGHTQRVTTMTLRLAEVMGVSHDKLVHIRRGALLHDIGKVGISDTILLKPSQLTPEEWVQMRKHPQFAYELLYPIEYLRPALEIPYAHHEHWDGTGYPRKLAGENIPFAARLFSVVDVWDALTTDRPYRKAWDAREAVDYLRSEKGLQFQPEIVDEFLRMFGN
jgi:response regulator RpfG family c-di-GMP phosphodiesterase